MSRAVTINTIANLAGVHKSTVSKALAGSKEISNETSARIKELAERLNYRPSSLARGLAGKHTKIIGIIAPELGDQYCVEVLNAQINYLQKKGYSSVLIVTNYSPEIELDCIEQILQKGADGILVNYELSEKKNIEQLKSLRDRGFPVVTFGQISPEVPSVELDFVKAYNEISLYLLKTGHRKIGYLFPFNNDHRLGGAICAYNEMRLKFNRDFAVSTQQCHEREFLSSILKKLLFELKATAIVCYCDDLAINVLGALADMGISVPDKVSVSSVNDVFFAQNALVPLTTYAWPISEIGMFSAGKLLEMIDCPDYEPFNKVFGGKLVIRKSTGINYSVAIQ